MREKELVIFFSLCSLISSSKRFDFFFLLLFYFFSLISISLTSESNFPGNSKVLILEFIPFFLPLFFIFNFNFFYMVLCEHDFMLVVALVVGGDDDFC